MREPVVKLKLKRIKGWAVTREGEVAAVRREKAAAQFFADRWAKQLVTIGKVVEVIVPTANGSRRIRYGRTQGV